MVLAYAMGRYRDELEADFQQYYGIDLERVGEACSVRHAAALAAQLPAESRVSRAACPGNEWGASEYILRLIEHDLRMLAWSGKGSRPKPVKTPEELRRRAASADVDVAALAERLGIPEDRR